MYIRCSGSDTGMYSVWMSYYDVQYWQKTITSILKVLTYNITAHPIGLAVILVIVSVLTLKTAVILWLVTGWLFSPGTPVTSTNKTDSHDVTEILLKVVYNPKPSTRLLKAVSTASKGSLK
jgi:hypothetical protein